MVEIKELLDTDSDAVLLQNDTKIKQAFGFPVSSSGLANNLEYSEMDDDDDDNDDDDSGIDSDRELQIALEKGYLKPGLNIVQKVVKKKWINNVSGLKAKLNEFAKNSLAWIERLDVTVERVKDEEESQESENDFKREATFIKQAQAAVEKVLPQLHLSNVATKRPDDYFAEMFKSDDHMKKVRAKLLHLQVSKQKAETARRFREERKFAMRLQKDAALEKQRDKQMLTEAVKKHKKGMKDQFEKIIGDEKNPNKKGNRKRNLKDEKYGHGGQKKRSKWNTAESSADFSSFGSSSATFSKSKKHQFGNNTNSGKGGGGAPNNNNNRKKFRANKNNKSKKNNRPGKQRRINMKNRKK